MVTGVIEKIRIKRLRPCKRQSVKRNIINVKMILILTLIYPEQQDYNMRTIFKFRKKDLF